MEIRPDFPEQEPLPPDAQRLRAGQGVDVLHSQLNTSDARGKPFTWWWLVSALALALILAIGGMEMFRYMARPLAMLVLGITIATALAPVVDWLTNRMPRTLAVILIYMLLILIMASIFGAMVPLVIAQVKSLGKESNVLLPQISTWFAQFGLDPSVTNSSLGSAMASLGSLAVSLPVNLLNGLFELALVIFLSLYTLLQMPQIKQFTLSFFRLEQRGHMARLLTEMSAAMGGYLRGAAISGLIIGALTYVGLLLIGVPYALTLAALAGLLEMFPTIGPIISGVAVTLVAFSVSPRTALIALIYAIVLQQTEGHILVPLIMRSQTKISPLLAIFAVVAGAAVGGLLGAIIAIPVGSVLTVLVKEVIAPRIRRANGVVAEEV